MELTGIAENVRVTIEKYEAVETIAYFQMGASLEM